MKKYQYSSRYQVNSKGFVPQEGEEVVGSKVIKSSGYFTSLEILKAHMKLWSRNIYYDYFLSPDDIIFNVTADIIPIAFDFDENGGDIAYHGNQQHDFWRIKVK